MMPISRANDLSSQNITSIREGIRLSAIKTAVAVTIATQLVLHLIPMLLYTYRVKTTFDSFLAQCIEHADHMQFSLSTPRLLTDIHQFAGKYPLVYYGLERRVRKLVSTVLDRSSFSSDGAYELTDQLQRFKSELTALS